MMFSTFLVPSKAAKMTPDSATPMGEVEYAQWPLLGHTVTIDGALYNVVSVPANILRASPVLVGGKPTDDGPKLHVYVIPT